MKTGNDMTDGASSEDRLLEQLAGGQENALAELFSLHRDRLWRMVNFRLDRRMYGRVDPDDVLQESYLDAANRISHYLKNPEITFFVWLRQIATQTLIDIHRRHIGAQMRDATREVAMHGVGLPQATSLSLAAHLLGHLTSPSQAALRAEASVLLERGLASMDSIDQEVLALRHFEELTNSEVSEVLGIQQKAASIRYVRAISRLKKVLEQMPDFEEPR